MSEVLATNLRIEDLELGVFSPRRVFDPKYVQELAESILREGQHKPILVRLHPEEPERYQVIDGEHRVRALQRLGRHLVRAEVRVLSDEEADLLAIRINQMHGRRLTELEEAEHVAKLHDKDGLTFEEIAERLSRSIGWVHDKYSLSERLSQKTKEIFKRLKITSTQAKELAELTHQEQDLVADKVAGLSTRKTEALVHALKEAETPEEKQRILSKPLEVYAEVFKTPEAFKTMAAAPPEKAVMQVYTCECGRSHTIDWIDQTVRPQPEEEETKLRRLETYYPTPILDFIALKGGEIAHAVLEGSRDLDKRWRELAKSLLSVLWETVSESPQLMPDVEQRFHERVRG